MGENSSPGRQFVLIAMQADKNKKRELDCKECSFCCTRYLYMAQTFINICSLLITKSMRVKKMLQSNQISQFIDKYISF